MVKTLNHIDTIESIEVKDNIVSHSVRQGRTSIVLLDNSSFMEKLFNVYVPMWLKCSTLN